MGDGKYWIRELLVNGMPRQLIEQTDSGPSSLWDVDSLRGWTKKCGNSEGCLCKFTK